MARKARLFVNVSRCWLFLGQFAPLRCWSVVSLFWPEVYFLRIKHLGEFAYNIMSISIYNVRFICNILSFGQVCVAIDKRRRTSFFVYVCVHVRVGVC